MPALVYIGWVTLSHGDVGQAVIYLGGGLFYLIAFLKWSCGSWKLADAMVMFLLSVLIVSLALAVMAPGLGLEAGRVRGLFENANGFGFVCFIAGAFAVVGLLRSSVSGLVFVLALTGIVFSGSRASLLALAITFSLHWLRRRPVGSVFLASGVAVLAWGFSSIFHSEYLGVGVLRTNDSRAESWIAAFDDARASNWFGVGLDNEIWTIASTPLRALSNGGIIGLLVILLAYGVLLWVVGARYRRLLPFAIGACVHSLFEGWLLSPVAPLLLIFIAAGISLNSHAFVIAGTHAGDGRGPAAQVQFRRVLGSKKSIDTVVTLGVLEEG